MFEVSKLFSLQREVFAQVQAILEMEKYLPFMSPEEMRIYEQAVMSAKMPDFSPDTIAKWREQANQRANELDAKFSDAMTKSDEFTNKYGINRWNLNSLEKDMSRDIFQTAWLSYLVDEYDVSAEWLLTGRGEIMSRQKKIRAEAKK